MDNKKRTKVLMAMSGGVDSSVAAMLLVQQGYEVTGAFMKQWSDSTELSGVCSWKEDRRDALRVAAHLGIPLITLDFEKEYNDWVMTYMFDEYKAGRTPNPDVLCNKYIKFGVWLDRARELGFDYLATGHYASTSDGKLLQAKDEEKDQTYFLHQLTSEQLRSTLFPIGEYAKKEVREMAAEHDIPTANREESMGICFVGEVPMKEFLLQKIDKKPGDVILADGTKIGEHDGLPFYTIGQRHMKIRNLKIKDQGPETKSLYVVDKRFSTNELVVGHEDDPLLFKEKTALTELSWVSGQSPIFPLNCKVRLRHRQELQACQVVAQDGVIQILFSQPQRAVTPGQFAVFYGNGECLGGGIVS